MSTSPRNNKNKLQLYIRVRQLTSASMNARPFPSRSLKMHELLLPVVISWFSNSQAKWKSQSIKLWQLLFFVSSLVVLGWNESHLANWKSGATATNNNDKGRRVVLRPRWALERPTSGISGQKHDTKQTRKNIACKTSRKSRKSKRTYNCQQMLRKVKLGKEKIQNLFPAQILTRAEMYKTWTDWLIHWRWTVRCKIYGTILNNVTLRKASSMLVFWDCHFVYQAKLNRFPWTSFDILTHVKLSSYFVHLNKIYRLKLASHRTYTHFDDKDWSRTMKQSSCWLRCMFAQRKTTNQ